MSTLSGVPGTNGRITVVAGAPVVFWKGLGFDAAGALCVDASAPGGLGNPVCMLTSAGRVMHDVAAAIAGYRSGVPVDANGAICTEVADPVLFSQGVGITAAGRVAIN